MVLHIYLFFLSFITFLSGMVQVAYIPLQFNIWWVSHMFVLYWGTRHPLKALHSKKCLSRVHFGVATAGILVPGLPILGLVISDMIRQSEVGMVGITLDTTPPILCVLNNIPIFVIFIVFPNCILALTGMTVLALLIWTIHKVRCHH